MFLKCFPKITTNNNNKKPSLHTRTGKDHHSFRGPERNRKMQERRMEKNKHRQTRDRKKERQGRVLVSRKWLRSYISNPEDRKVSLLWTDGLN